MAEEELEVEIGLGADGICPFLVGPVGPDRDFRDGFGFVLDDPGLVDGLHSDRQREPKGEARSRPSFDLFESFGEDQGLLRLAHPGEEGEGATERAEKFSKIHWRPPAPRGAVNDRNLP